MSSTLAYNVIALNDYGVNLLDTSATVSENLFTGNTRGLHCDLGAVPGVISNTFHNNYIAIEEFGPEAGRSLHHNNFIDNTWHVFMDNASSDVNASTVNYGNARLDVALNGSSLNCEVGSVAESYIRYHCSQYGQAYGDMSALSDTLTSINCTEFDLQKSTTGTGAPDPREKDLPWKIQIPHSTEGNCQGLIWFAAVAG